MGVQWNQTTLNTFQDLVDLIQNHSYNINVLNTLPVDVFYQLVVTQTDFANIPAIPTTNFLSFDTLLTNNYVPIVDGNYFAQLNPLIFSDKRIMNFTFSQDQALNLIIPANRNELNAYSTLSKLLNTILNENMATPFITKTPLPPAYLNLYCYAMNDGMISRLRKNYTSKFQVNQNVSLSTATPPSDPTSGKNIDIYVLLNRPELFATLSPSVIPLFDFYASTGSGSLFETIIYNHGNLQNFTPDEYTAMTPAMKTIVDKYLNVIPATHLSESISDILSNDAASDGGDPDCGCEYTNPLWIYMGAANTNIQSPVFTASDIQYTTHDISYHFVVDIMISRTSIRNAFTYIIDSTGATIYLFSNKNAFELTRVYSPDVSCNTVRVTANDYRNAIGGSVTPPTFGSLTTNYKTGYDIVGPVIDRGNVSLVMNTTTGFPYRDNVPMTWSYMQYLADNMLCNYSWFTMFNHRFAKEQELYKNINDSFTTKLRTLLDAIDISGAMMDGFAPIDISGIQIGYGYNYDHSRTISSDSPNLIAVMFNALYSKDPKRFEDPRLYESTPMGFDENGVTIQPLQRYMFPFMTGDVIQTLFTIQPNSSMTPFSANNPAQSTVYLLNMRVVQ